MNTNTHSSPLNTFQEKTEPSLSMQCLSITLYYWETHLYSMFVHGCSRSRRLESLEHSISKLEKKVTHAITCLRSRLTQLASFEGGASLFGSSRNVSIGPTRTGRWERRLKKRRGTSGVWPLVPTDREPGTGLNRIRSPRVKRMLRSIRPAKVK